MQMNVRSLFGACCVTLLASTIGFAQAPAGPNRPAGVPEDYVITPFGYFHPSCVRHLASGDQVSSDGLAIQHANGTVSHAAACEYPRYTAQGEVIIPGSPTVPPTISHSWIVDGETTTGTSYGQINATWNVPSAPAANNGQTIYFFPGLEDFRLNQTILQPVLGWNADFSAAWGLASWNCCPSGTANESTALHVVQGDAIFGQVKSTCSAGTLTCSKWNVTSQDTTLNSTTTLSNTPNEGQTLNWAFGGALEVYNVAQCANYPSNDSLTFSTALYDNNFNIIGSPGWSMVNRAAGLTPQCNYGGQISGGQVTVVFGNGATLNPVTVDFGTWDINHPPVSRMATLTNYTPSTITGLSVGGLSDTMSVSSTTCGSSLAAGASCSITVTLIPGNAGGAETITQTLKAFDSAPNSPQATTVKAKITCSRGC